MIKTRWFFLLLPVLGFGCSQKANESSGAGKSKMKFTFPRSMRNKVQTASSAFDYNNGCYAISITAKDIANESDSPCDKPYGIFQGMVSPTSAPPVTTSADDTSVCGPGEICIEVPYGDARTVTIYGFDKPVGTGGCPELGKDFGDIPRNKLYIVGNSGVPFNTDTPDYTVNIQIELPSASKNLMDLWTLPQSCPREIKTPVAGVGERLVRQTGGKFVLEARAGTLSRPTAMSGGKFVLEIKTQ